MAIIEVVVPDIGDFDKVDIIEVMVKVGQTIAKEDPLITLETDKATMEIPSSHAGVVKELKVKPGDKVSRGSVILVVESAGTVDQKTAAPAATQQAAPHSVPETLKQAPTAVSAATGVVAQTVYHQDEPEVADSEGVHAGPATRRLARELGVSLSALQGSGRKGRVLTSDIHQYVKNRLSQPASGGLSIAPMKQIDFSQFGEIDRRELSRIKQLTAEHTHRSWVSIPHVTQFDEADITLMENFRQENRASVEKLGVKLTPLVFIMKAVVTALIEYPQFNSSLGPDGKHLILKKYYHLGVAVETPNGLVVPVIRHVNAKSLLQLATELQELSLKAREKGLSSSEMQGGCFTISSLGGIGGTAFTPIVNAPEVAILGVSRSEMKPVYQKETKQFEPRLMLPLSLSYDHRVIDGAEAARFTRTIADALSDIRRLLL